MKFLGPLAATAWVVLIAHAVGATPIAILPAHTASPTPSIGSQSGPSPIRRAQLAVKLPDSTVARLYMGKTRFVDISRRDFVQATAQLELPPGPLTPGMRQQVLDLLLQKRLLSAHASRDPAPWTRADSLNYRSLVDRLTLRAALDSAMAEEGFAIASRGDTVPGRDRLGLLVRESAMARLKPIYDDSLAQRIATAFLALPQPTPDMNIQEQLRVRTILPSLSSEDSARALATTPEYAYTAGELLSDFGRLNRVYRPDIRTIDDVRGAVNNVIYERLLRANVVKQGLEQRPSIAGPLAQRAEYLNAQAYVRRAAYDRVPTDTATVRRHYDRHPRWFDTWGSADILRGVFPTREEAAAFAKRLALPDAIDSLANAKMPNGASYATYLTEDADTALFARVRKAGLKGVVGPDETVDGWRVIRAVRIEPRRPRSFAEAFDIALNDWYQRDGDRRVRELMQKLSASTLYQLNGVAMAKLDSVAPSAAPGRNMPVHGGGPRTPR